jgi:hypothetical protein
LGSPDQLVVLAGLIVCGLSILWLLFIAYEESVLWGLACLCLPLVMLIFVALHWRKARWPFVCYLGGFAVVFLWGVATGVVQVPVKNGTRSGPITIRTWTPKKSTSR